MPKRGWGGGGGGIIQRAQGVGGIEMQFLFIFLIIREKHIMIGK